MLAELQKEDRTNYILQSLNAGISREELAIGLNHSDYRSLDMYMRRHGYTWDKEIQNYVPKEKKISQEQVNGSIVHPGKINQIIALFEAGHDAKEVAKKLLFPNHRSLADYMKEKHYEWDNKIRNYVPMAHAESKELQEQKNNEVIEEQVSDSFINQIPRYLIPGIAQNKNVQLSHLLNQLVLDFSYENNITQRQIFESAILEFLMKHGYRHEVKALFQK
ncbi:hypothetical protein [Pseudobacillus badius]|uniref:hypothetical protein n=1 Tax=Bacillus badius TaxID=1455 RepID=UPI0007B333A1|nr:hypothetical protein [Bacillus badius]KZR57546.1 hypothetical protein A3781_01820 [Bacillus badius]MED0665928.1 hypothetical protein [Bacillus badius]